MLGHIKQKDSVVRYGNQFLLLRNVMCSAYVVYEIERTQLRNEEAAARVSFKLVK
jgi:hypothetical protein